MKKMKKIKKRINVDGVIRIVLTGIAVIAQLILLILILTYMKQSAVLLYFLLEMLSLAGALILAVKNEIQAYTVPWLIIIFMLPVFGFLLYLLWGRTGMHGRKSRRMRDILAQSGQWLKPDESVLAHLEHSHPAVRTMPRYIEREGFPLYKNTDCRYYELGEMQFEQMLTDLEDAEKFIFLEYFIVAQGKLWERVHEVLRRKAAEGVDVRLFFDDMGSLLVFPSKVYRQLKAENIKVRRFNPVHKNISRFYINYRNHQKIVVIDGNIGYT
ncbi:MAG: PLDc N-terminal domain-containing protein, partial [Eubacteriales bacterium]|nr:PLDc N-terminal domain-containing protein [Eubacteriales bacterium]